MIKQSLEIKQTQKLSPIQLQTIKFIELPLLEFEQRVKDAFDENPVLEDDAPQDTRDEDDEPKDISIEELKEDDDFIPGYRLRVNNQGKDELPQRDTFSVKESFTQTLEEQLGFRELSAHEYDIASFIIGSLDDDGYLRRDLGSIVDDLAFRAGIETDEEEVLRMLSLIQEFEPAGVGARNLQECLLLQIRNLKESDDTRNAEIILRDYFNEFTSKHFQKIMGKAGLSAEQLKSAMAKILKLNPAPGGQVDDSYNDRAQQVVPDFILNYENGQFHMSIPRFKIPEIRIKKKYAEMLEDSKSSGEKAQKEAAAFVKQKIDSAKWLIEAIKQRYNTLESTMNAIIDYQSEYFIDGDESNLRPMVLKDIAEVTGFDISTISRVVNSKYIETHFGIFPLKYFFSEGLENKEGNEVSTRELKKAISELVENEDKLKPLTDDQLVAAMNARGYNVARRTIAKYRDQLGIPKARLRKAL